MTDEQPLVAFLTTDPKDMGCGQTWAMIHVYAELVLAGEDPDVRFPGIAVHLAACPPCDQDFQGLMVALRSGLR